MIMTIPLSGVIDVNCYFYGDDSSGRGFLIDPGAQPELLANALAQRGLAVEKILLTHGHFDHIGGVGELQRTLKVPVIMGEGGEHYAGDTNWNLSRLFGQPMTLEGVTYVAEGATLSIEGTDFALAVISAPGHTLDGVIYYDARRSTAFVGDTIFRGSYGRVDFPGGDPKVLFETIRRKVFTLPAQTLLLSGHGEPTTVADEMSRAWY